MRRIAYLAVSLAFLLSGMPGCREDAPTYDAAPQSVSTQSVSTESVATGSVSAEGTTTDGISAEEVLKKAEEAYKALETYESEGSAVMEMDMDEHETKTETSFSMRLKKPNLYRISWSQKNAMTPMATQRGAVWSDGTQPYLYMGIINAYSKIDSDEMALGAATGISSGAAITIPSMFLVDICDQHGQSLSQRLNNPVVERTERFEGHPCYVVSGSSAISKKETFWISKTDHLIRRYERSLEPPEGGFQMPEITEEDIEDTLRSLGQELTEELKKDLSKMMDLRHGIAEVQVKGTFTEVHRNVASPELSQGDFEYAPPEGVVLKESLFEGVFGDAGPHCMPPGDAALPKESLFGGSRTRPGNP